MSTRNATVTTATDCGYVVVLNHLRMACDLRAVSYGSDDMALDYPNSRQHTGRLLVYFLLLFSLLTSPVLRLYDVGRTIGFAKPLKLQ